MSTDPPPPPPSPPLLRVVRGEPTPAELAALVVVLTARTASAVPPEPATPSRSAGWADRASSLRRRLAPGPGAWSRSARTAGARTRADW